MRSFGQVPETALAPPPAAPLAITPMPGAKEIPYDYVARFQLLGKRGERVQDVINIRVEGAFVAAAIGYSFLPAQLDTRAVTTLKSTFSSIPFGGAIVLYGKLSAEWPIRRKNFILVSLFVCAASTSNTASSTARAGASCKINPSTTSRAWARRQAIGRSGLLPSRCCFCRVRRFASKWKRVSEGSLYGDKVDRRNGAELFIVLHGYKILGYGAGQR